MFLEHIKRNFFTYSVIILTILTALSSFYRFMVVHDYTFYDEFECDPLSGYCFVYCEDGTTTCEDAWYYTEVERYAADVMRYCDGDTSDCDAMYECQEDEHKCITTTCDPEIHTNQCVHISTN